MHFDFVDLRLLTVSGPYRIDGFEVVDMFPQTPHIECVAELVKASEPHDR